MSRLARRGHRRRALTTVALAATAAAFVAACSPPAEDGNGEGQERPAAEGGAFPVTIEHALGATTIDEAPTRVAAMGVGDADNLLALGITPTTVAAFGSPPEYSPWLADYLDDAEPTLLPNASNEFSGEVAKTLATNPDLITAIGADPTEEEYTDLSEAVNVVTRPADTQAWLVPWDVQALEIGRAVGLEEAATSEVERTRAALKQVRDDNNFGGKSAAAVSANPDGTVAILSPEDGRGQTLTEYGFEFPEGLRGLMDQGFYGTISAERLDVLADVDVLVVLDWEGSNDTLQANPAWQGLAATQEGRVAYIDQAVGTAMSVPTLLSIPWVSERAVPIIAEAIQ